MTDIQPTTITTGERLSWFRNGSGHTQESLAEASGVSRQTISLIERNKGGKTGIETLEALLKACGVTLVEFFRYPEGRKGRSGYFDNEHTRLHTMLDDILAAGEPYSGAMKCTIEGAHAKLGADRAAVIKREVA